MPLSVPTVAETRAAAAEAVYAALPPVFRDCREDGSVKYDIGVPFVIGEHVYGTDGRFMVRLPFAAVPPDLPALVAAARGNRPFPKTVPTLFAGAWSAEGVPVPDLSDAPRCPDCAGSGLAEQISCATCGEVTKTPGHSFPCHDCRGTGIEDAHEDGIEVAGALLAYGYLAVLARHSATLYPATGGDPEAPVRFTLPCGTEGLLMPIKF